MRAAASSATKGTQPSTAPASDDAIDSPDLPLYLAARGHLEEIVEEVDEGLGEGALGSLDAALLAQDREEIVSARPLSSSSRSFLRAVGTPSASRGIGS